MIESEDFLSSLNHSNLNRPHFAIGKGLDAQLKITHQGQVMRLPIAEILSFAQRWCADQDRKWETRGLEGAGLRVFPYPPYSTNMSDPDVIGVDWDAV